HEVNWLFLSIGFTKEEEQELLNMFKEVIGREDVFADHFTPIIAAHTGNRTVGIGYTKKYN
ncbi:MAG: DegV family protein, partial [Erysipelotrichales bacterium]|nr:DegV family protein [Erysipelotrichales bacterium]